jgi:two-component system cell cycle sensor histidine kinase/response regulator CckA
VLFPASDATAPLPAGESFPAKPWRGAGTVLIVDDDELNRMSTQVLFKQAGFSTLTAEDGEEAVRVYREHRDQIVCVFLDLTLPKMDGEETLRELRQLAPEVRAIVTSGCSSEILAERFAGLDVLGFVCKPESPDDVIAKLRKALGGR